MFLTYYVICVAYCFYQLYKNYNRRYDTNGIGASPELDTVMVMVMAWILAPVDVSLTWIRWYREAQALKKAEEKEKSPKIY